MQSVSFVGKKDMFVMAVACVLVLGLGLVTLKTMVCWIFDLNVICQVLTVANLLHAISGAMVSC